MMREQLNDYYELIARIALRALDAQYSQPLHVMTPSES